MTTDAKILTALRANPDGVSGASLAEQLKISRAAIWSRIEELRQAGYEIEASPHFGYHLVHSPDALHADDLLARLAGIREEEDEGRPRSMIIGRDIQVFKETTSTNDVIEKLARDGVREGVVVFAESQTRGRGRLGRKWVSPANKGLWFSILLRPRVHPQESTQLTVVSATALRRAIMTKTDLRPEIKWPNDILIGGKKVAGILTELSAELDRVKHITLGIGVDVNVDAGELPPEVRKVSTSLKIEAGEAISRVELAAEILRELDRDYARMCTGNFLAVADEWEAGCATIGKNVNVQMGDRKISGCAESLDEDGALLVRTEHGHLERVIGGDVTLEK
ncbi:MAG: biotin--[acetyl-CoA-carboxylase] ligase [Verrucomicrobiota bacterium]|jgi:BirA family biotin operon repressor/biotin-[acetyl-CoA-carboxylase] ligase